MLDNVKNIMTNIIFLKLYSYEDYWMHIALSKIYFKEISIDSYLDYNRMLKFVINWQNVD